MKRVTVFLSVLFGLMMFTMSSCSSPSSSGGPKVPPGNVFKYTDATLANNTYYKFYDAELKKFYDIELSGGQWVYDISNEGLNWFIIGDSVRFSNHDASFNETYVTAEGKKMKFSSSNPLDKKELTDYKFIDGIITEKDGKQQIKIDGYDEKPLVRNNGGSRT